MQVTADIVGGQFPIGRRYWPAGLKAGWLGFFPGRYEAPSLPASHVGYLDRGRLQFSEEMTSLAERFREIEITLTAPSPAQWPAAWFSAETSAAVVRFAHASRGHAQTEETRVVSGQVLAVRCDVEEIFELELSQLGVVLTGHAASDGEDGVDGGVQQTLAKHTLPDLA